MAQHKITERCAHVLRALLDQRTGADQYEWLTVREVADQLAARNGQPVSSMSAGQIISRLYGWDWVEVLYTGDGREVRLTREGADLALEALAELPQPAQAGRAVTMKELEAQLHRENPLTAPRILASVRAQLQGAAR